METDYLERLEILVNFWEKGYYSEALFMRTCFLPEVGDNPVEIVKAEWNKKNEEWEKIQDRLLRRGGWFENVKLFSEEFHLNKSSLYWKT